MSKPKYKPGDTIKSLDELMEQTWVYIPLNPLKIMHIEAVKSMTLRTVMMFMGLGIRKAELIKNNPSPSKNSKSEDKSS